MIKAVLIVLYNVLRVALNKVVYGASFDVHWLQRISPLCTVKIFGKGCIQIGYNCELAAYCDFEAHGMGKIIIGEKTYFNRYCMISAHELVSVGKACMFGPGVRIFDNNHKHSSEIGVSTNLTTAPIHIGHNTWIGANVVILKGAYIGDNCVIGAGCVVSGIVPDGRVLVNKQNHEYL